MSFGLALAAAPRGRETSRGGFEIEHGAESSFHPNSMDDSLSRAQETELELATERRSVAFAGRFAAAAAVEPRGFRAPLQPTAAAAADGRGASVPPGTAATKL